MWGGPPQGHPNPRPAHPAYDDPASPLLSTGDFAIPLTCGRVPVPPLNTPTLENHDLAFGPQSNVLDAFMGQPYSDTAQDLHFDLANLNPMISHPNTMEPFSVDMFDLEPDHLDFTDAMEDLRPGNPPKTSDTTSPASTDHSTPTLSWRATSVDFETASYESWPGFACNPSPAEPLTPKTTKFYLEKLKMALRNGGSWKSDHARGRTSQKSSSNDEAICSEIRNDGVRDKLLVVIQTLMHKATAMHGRHIPHDASFANRVPAKSENDSFVPLPPVATLEQFLRTYMARFESRYRFVTKHGLKPSEMLGPSTGESSRLLLLLMIAHGAMVGSYADWCLSSTLTEACRISFLEIAGTDPSRLGEKHVFCTGLGMIGLTTWSGEAWHMNVSSIERLI